MVSILKLKDKQLFVNSLKPFLNKRHATIEITKECISISSIDSPYIYISLEDSVFIIDIPISFTIRIDELNKAVNLIKSSVILLDESFKLVLSKHSEEQDFSFLNNLYFKNVESELSFVEIPFINPITSHYIYKKYFPNKIIIMKECLKSLMKGLVRYKIADNKLIIYKQTSEHEEIMAIEGDVLDVGHLDFYCSNEWVESVLEVYDLINTVLFCFSDGLLSIKFLLKHTLSSYMEVQVLEI